MECPCYPEIPGSGRPVCHYGRHLLCAVHHHCGAPGYLAATKQYSRTDYVITAAALVGISLPTFFFATLLKLFFSVKLGWFDLYGLVGRDYAQLDSMGQFLDKANHLVLPIATLVIVSIGGYMRYTRTNMLEVLNADYIRTGPRQGPVGAYRYL